MLSISNQIHQIAGYVKEEKSVANTLVIVTFLYQSFKMMQFNLHNEQDTFSDCHLSYRALSCYECSHLNKPGVLLGWCVWFLALVRNNLAVSCSRPASFLCPERGQKPFAILGEVLPAICLFCGTLVLSYALGPW